MQIIKQDGRASVIKSNIDVKSQNTNRTIPTFRLMSSRSTLKSSQSIRPPHIQKKPTESEDFDSIISTPYDDELFSNTFIYQEYKHKCNAPMHLRQEQVYRFIFDKKSSNKLKYSTTSKITQQALPVASGSISIMLNVQKKDQGFNLQSFKKKIAPKSKFKMKWKTIQWLLKNRKDAIKQIFSNYQYMIRFAKSKKEDGMNKEEFCELLSFVGLGADQNLAEKLFYVFDDNSNGYVDYKELIVGLEVLKDDSIEEKLRIFFDLCDEDGSGKISEKEILKILKQNVISDNDKYQLKQTVHEMIKQVDQDGDGELNKEEILMAARNNPILRRILEQTISNVKRIDSIIQNDLEEPFHQFVPSSTNLVQVKEGIHFATFQKILDYLDDIETIDQRVKDMKFRTKIDGHMGHQTYMGLQENNNLDDSLNL